jgi:hypothetical protein
MIGDIPWGICYGSEKFGLVSLDDSYIGLWIKINEAVLRWAVA